MLASFTIRIPADYRCVHGGLCAIAGEIATVVGSAPNPEYLLIEVKEPVKRCPYSAKLEVTCAVPKALVSSQLEKP